MICAKRPDGTLLNLSMARILRYDRGRGGLLAWGYSGPITERCYLIPGLTVTELGAHCRNVARGCSEPIMHRDWQEVPYVSPA